MSTNRQRPYIASYCFIRNDDKILFQRRFNTGYLDGMWGLPSGFVNEGEDALMAASRELQEETGLIVSREDWRFLCIMHRRTSIEIIDVFFLTDTYTGVPRICEPLKCDGLGFYQLRNLPRPLIDYIELAAGYIKSLGHQGGTINTIGWS
jgi:ADP-ribose pyrophosphatase YjhB (NUDIX family)